MLNPLGRDQAVGDSFYLFCFAAQQQHLETKMWIEMNMYRRDDRIQMVVLIFGQLFFEFALMVVIDQSQSANSFRVFFPQFSVDEKVADDIANSLRTVAIALRVR